MNTGPEQIARLISKMFIARADVKAIQRPNGDYNPVKKNKDEYAPFKMGDLLDHQDQVATYGHYLLNKDSQCKLFAFDIDLDEPDERHPELDEFLRMPTQIDSCGIWNNFVPCNPREVWKDRSQQLARSFFKYEMRLLASLLANQIQRQFEIQTAVAYSGAKGVHVYGFTGLLPAEDVREGALIILKSLDRFELLRGQSFFKHKKVTEEALDSPMRGQLSHDESFQSLTIEVFPKQTTVSSDGFGNLMRLPLGKNLKNPQDPTFFLDLRSNFSTDSFKVRDPVDALTAKDQYLRT